MQNPINAINVGIASGGNNISTISSNFEIIVMKASCISRGREGAIENANKLIRQYIPKNTTLDEVSDKKLAFLIAKIKDRPREKLNFDSPKNRFFIFFV